LRTVPLLSSSGDAYVVETPRRETLRLDALDTMLLELSAGKLTLGEIAPSLRPGPPTCRSIKFVPRFCSGIAGSTRSDWFSGRSLIRAGTAANEAKPVLVKKHSMSADSK
jgi:hypothetical protein